MAVLPSLMTTGDQYDYAIDGDGLFAVYNPQEDQVYFTRNGHFHLSNYGEDLFYLAAEDGSLVLDEQMGLIPIYGNISQEEELKVGIFDFAHKEGFVQAGDNRYLPAPGNGQPYLAEGAKLRQGMLEASNVDLADQMARVIESSRAYQMTLKMIQTTDEVEQTINSLR